MPSHRRTPTRRRAFAAAAIALAVFAAAAPGATHAHAGSITASQETPADTMIYQVVPADHYATNHVIVMQGYGLGCGCTVLFQSGDAGKTWVAGPDSLDDIYLSLPPAYPQDPRIFTSGPQSGTNGTWMIPSVGQPAQLMTIPASYLALDPDFDSGSPYIYYSDDTGGVYAYDADTGNRTLLVMGANEFYRHIISPAGDGSGVALYIPADSGDVIVSPPSGVGSQLPFSSSGRSVVTCRHDFTCAYAGQIQGPPYQAEVNPDDSSGTQVAFDGFSYFTGSTFQDGFGVTSDGARSFTPVFYPDPSFNIFFAYIYGSSAQGPAMWTEGFNSANLHILANRSPEGTWTVPPQPPNVSGTFGVHMVSDTQIIAADTGPNQTGFDCSIDGAQTWTVGTC